MPTLIAALFTIAKMWKQAKYPSTDEWVNKMWYIYIYIYIYKMEYHPLFKKKEILPYATTWMNLEDIMLSEMNQSQKDKYCIILFK